MRVDWKAELHSRRFGKAPIREGDCWLANQTSVRRLRFRSQTHLLLKACLFPPDITNVGLHSLLLNCSVFLHLSPFNTFSFGFHLFSCLLCYLPFWLISLFPVLSLPLHSIQIPPTPPFPNPPPPILSPSLPSSTSNMMGGELPGAESGRESYSISETLCSPAWQPLAKLIKAGKNGAQWGGVGLAGVQNSCLASRRSV